MPESDQGDAYPHPDASPRRLRRFDALIALAILAVIMVQGAVTIERVGVSWDEPYYYLTSRQYLSWLSAPGPGRFSADTLQRVFGFKPKKNDHPTLGKIIPAVTYALFKGRMNGFFAWRLSAPLLFGILLAALYLRAAAELGRAAGLAATLCLAFMPRFFVHGHIAATDAPLALFWFMAAWSYEAACRKPRLAPLIPLTYGLAMSIKFTGVLLPIPLLAWGLCYRRRSMLRPSLALLLGPAVFLLLEPAMWRHPASGLYEFLHMSMTRQAWNPRWMLFMGKVYPFSPPWYYAPFMSLITVPETVAALFIGGTARALRGRLRDPGAGSALVNFMFFMLITMAPDAPIFDGVRLFLPAFVFMALLAGSGFQALMSWLAERGKRLARPGTAVTAALLLFTTALPLVHVYPYGLEYYNYFIGGVAGARRAGMETTYWWTALAPRDLAGLDRWLPEGATLRFFPMDPDLHELYQDEGLLRRDIKCTDGPDFDYVLVLSRPYWNYPPIFRDFLHISQRELTALRVRELDGVPLWVLYKKPPAVNH